jgi:hypothetical protein
MVATFMGSEATANKLINAGANVSVCDSAATRRSTMVQRGFARSPNR